jgi:hypothetical protein
MSGKLGLFDGVRRNINHALTEAGCPIKTTGQLCQQFKILYQYPDEVEGFAQTYNLARTVNQPARPPAPPSVSVTPASPPQNDQLAAEEEAAIQQAEVTEVPAYQPPPKRRMVETPQVVPSPSGQLKLPVARTQTYVDRMVKPGYADRLNKIEEDIRVIFINLHKVSGMAKASYAFLKDPRVVEQFPPRKQESDAENIRLIMAGEAEKAQKGMAEFQARQVAREAQAEGQH